MLHVRFCRIFLLVSFLLFSAFLFHLYWFSNCYNWHAQFTCWISCLSCSSGACPRSINWYLLFLFPISFSLSLLLYPFDFNQFSSLSVVSSILDFGGSWESAVRNAASQKPSTTLTLLRIASESKREKTLQKKKMKMGKNAIKRNKQGNYTYAFKVMYKSLVWYISTLIL